MFDPNKYDNASNYRDDNENKYVNDFIVKRNSVIKFLKDYKNIMIKECESMENYIDKNPNGKAVGPFTEKLEGWAKIINGINIISEKYSNTKE